MLNKLLLLLLLTSPAVATLSAQDVEARFTMEKSIYLIGEPTYVVLSISNKSKDSVWVDLGPTDMLCQMFQIEVPGTDSAREQWGCGIGASCGSSLWEVAPGGTKAVRQLLNQEFRLQHPGTYIVRAATTITVRSQNLWSSAPLDEIKVSDNLSVEVQVGVGSQLQAAFQPIVKDLASKDPHSSREAAIAIIETAPPFLEDVLMELTKTDYSVATMTALRKADTKKTRDALARIANDGESSMLRVEAIRNLGRTGDETYLPALVQLMKSPDIQIQGASAEAVANLGGYTAIPAITVLLSNADVQRRQAGANGLQYTHAREAVPILIGLLLDSEASIRQTAVSGLALLTHRAAFAGNQWADVTTPQSANNVHQRWIAWWKSQEDGFEIHGMNDCVRPESLD